MSRAKRTKSGRSKAKVVGLALGTVVVVGGAWAMLLRGQNAGDDSALPPELRREALAKAEATPETFRQVRDAFRSDELTDDQKRELAKNLRDSRRASMEARVNEYFDAPDYEKSRILDDHIDEFIERRKEFEKRREAGELPERPLEEEREQMRQLFRPQSQQERKSRSESRSADQTARMMTYFQAMQSRAKERGIEMPRGPGRGGRGGPGGGGPGGGGPGGGGPGGGRRP